MDIKDLVKNNSSAIIEKLLTDILTETYVDVSFDFFEQDQWALVSLNQYEEDKEFSIRLHNNGVYDLLVGYYDDEDEFFEIVHLMTEAEVASIPEGLKKVMAKVVSTEDGLRVPSNLLIGKK